MNTHAQNKATDSINPYSRNTSLPPLWLGKRHRGAVWEGTTQGQTARRRGSRGPPWRQGPAHLGVQSQAKGLIAERSLLGREPRRGASENGESDPRAAPTSPCQTVPGEAWCVLPTHSGVFLEHSGPSGPGGSYWADGEEVGRRGNMRGGVRIGVPAVPGTRHRPHSTCRWPPPRAVPMVRAG